MLLPLNILASLGSWTLHRLKMLGAITLFGLAAARLSFVTARFFAKVVQQIYVIGAQSFFVVALIGIFSGMVIGLQGYYTLVQFGSEGLLGAAVALTLIRELGPVLTAIMVTGRAGSSMTAEIGVMRISEQLDALEVMDINPIGYLVSPRLIAALIVFPMLTAIFDLIGMFGGYLTGVVLLGINQGAFIDRIFSAVVMNDVSGGFLKSLVFAVLVSISCCYQGYTAHTRRDSTGPEAVGNATTSAVVVSCVLILVSDYILTSLLL